MTDNQENIVQPEAPSNVFAPQSPYVFASIYQPDPNISPLIRVRGTSIASLILGVASVPLGNFVLGIIGLVLARRALKGTPEGVDNRFARVGKTCSIIGIVLSAVGLFAAIGFIAYMSYLSNRPMTF